ncbi:MAG: lysophospholipid acyltransferase family protein [Syntrophales bacterium]
MVNIEHLDRIRLVSSPLVQRILATILLKPNYNLFARVEIEVENMEKIPTDETVIFAMNHTDRYNYWPFQYKLWTMKCFPYTTVWVKAKYYRNAILGKALDWCNLIPVPSMGYLIEEFYKKRFRKRIDSIEYRTIKDFIDGKLGAESLTKLGSEVSILLRENFFDFIKNYYESVMARVAQLSRSALLEKGLDLIIFPEGTRSLKLAEGKTGIAQLALHTEKKIVPVGCSNCEEVYCWTLPFARSGKITYRVGDPLSVHDELRKYRIKEEFSLFSRESQKKYKEKFENVTRIIMERINRIVDEKYKSGEELRAEG